ncbi:MAG: beta-propeller fold lactonase family protein [Rouxiella aceris]|uniref:lactonase family protein n=1 Tax=Rouxiella aceris TaxID=2703884 RepID=UPI00284BCA60|nr:beta-propeller fold lactonase family protein [Rouxiella aceris]MDR3434708.1 beta-propeller fold lactonase family protein [Rouxiella aceris]
MSENVFTVRDTSKEPCFVYVSNADSGTIGAYKLNRGAQQLEPLGNFPAASRVMSSAISADKQRLYVAVRSQPYRVLVFRIEQDGTLQQIGQSSLAENMAFISLDHSGNFLLAASYGGDLFSINRIDPEGQVVTPPVQIVHTGKRAHAIQVGPDNSYLYVTLLGSDQLLQFHFDAASGKVAPLVPAAVNIQKEVAAGPRHFVIAPQPDKRGKYNLYVLAEMAGSISRLTLAADGTACEHEEIYSLSPQEDLQRGEARPLSGDNDLPPSAKPRIWQADIHLTPDGRFLYSTERTSGTLSSFAVNVDNGQLRYLGSIKTEAMPRSFAIDNSGNFLILAGQQSNQLALYRIDKQSGTLTLLDRYPTANGPTWISIV